MHRNQYSDLFVTYRKHFKLNTGNNNPNIFDEETLVTQSSMAPPLVFDSVKKTFNFIH